MIKLIPQKSYVNNVWMYHVLYYAVTLDVLNVW